MRKTAQEIVNYHEKFNNIKHLDLYFVMMGVVLRRSNRILAVKFTQRTCKTDRQSTKSPNAIS
jgi:hypothetical protein